MVLHGTDINVLATGKPSLLQLGTVHNPVRSTRLRAADTFESAQLRKRLGILRKDAVLRLIILGKQRTVILGRINRILNQSEKLVKMYNLPPIKYKSQDKSVPEYGRSRPRHGEKTRHLSEESRRQSEPVMSLTPPMLTHGPSESWLDTHQSVRRAMGSPVPRSLQTEEENLENRNFDFDTLHHPKITIDTCIDGTKTQTRPSYRHFESKVGAPIIRSKSANNLAVPSQMLTRRRKISATGSWQNLWSDKAQEMISSVDIHRSEGNIPLALHQQRSTLDPRYIALESSLQPGPLRIGRPYSKSPCSRSRSADGRNENSDFPPLLEQSSNRSASPTARRASPKVPVRLVPLRYNHQEV